MFNKLQVLAGLSLGWGGQWGGLNTHTHCSQPIFSCQSLPTLQLALRLEKQSYLCAHVSDGFMWLSATAIWQRTAHLSWAETNGKTNIRLISKEGEECAGEVRLQVLTAPPTSPVIISSPLCVFMWAALRRQEHETKGHSMCKRCSPSFSSTL